LDTVSDILQTILQKVFISKLRLAGRGLPQQITGLFVRFLWSSVLFLVYTVQCP